MYALSQAFGDDDYIMHPSDFAKKDERNKKCQAFIKQLKEADGVVGSIWSKTIEDLGAESTKLYTCFTLKILLFLTSETAAREAKKRCGDPDQEGFENVPVQRLSRFLADLVLRLHKHDNFSDLISIILSRYDIKTWTFTGSFMNLQRNSIQRSLGAFQGSFLSAGRCIKG